MSADAPVEETLAWEAEKRPRIAAAAIAGGVATVAGNTLLLATTSDAPSGDDGFIGLTEAVDARLGGQAPEGPSQAVRFIDFLGDNAPLLSISTVLTALGVACLALLTLYLWRATAARSPLVGRLPLYSAMTGLILAPLGQLVWQLMRWWEAAGFSDAPVRTAEAAREVNAAPAIVAGSLAEALGTFALAVAVVIVALNAMRVGLLTRFLGVLGIFVGVVPVLGLLSQGFQLDQPGVIRAFWMIAVGLLIAGRLRTPPAWQTGRAEPWPSRQQLLEQRQPAGGRPRPEPDGGGDERRDKPAEMRKKRKRRR